MAHSRTAASFVRCSGHEEAVNCASRPQEDPASGTRQQGDGRNCQPNERSGRAAGSLPPPWTEAVGGPACVWILVCGEQTGGTCRPPAGTGTALGQARAARKGRGGWRCGPR